MKPHSGVAWTLFIGTDLKRTLINLIGLGDLFVAGTCQPHCSCPSCSARVESGLEPQPGDFYRAGLSAGIALFLLGKSQSCFL